MADKASRLVDYFVVVGFDDSKERSGRSVGKILQRFPLIDWPDVSFFHGLELFCQPEGWRLWTSYRPPTFFISVLTDIEAVRHYVACLSFCEARFASAATLNNDDEDSSATLYENLAAEPAAVRTIGRVGCRQNRVSPVLYSPKCLVIVSRHEYFEAFKNCLGTIYAVYSSNELVALETLVGNLLSVPEIPPAGGQLVKFSLGAGDRQGIQLPVCSSIPATKACVAVFFQQLGIFNALCVFCALLTERKILVYSRSYNRLTEACHALRSLIYPLKYSHVYVPVLPGSLLEVLHSPTPFVMGLHSNFKPQVSDLADVISVDVDTGSVLIPPTLNVPGVPEPYNSRLLTNLSLVLNRELFTADYAFPTSSSQASIPLVIIDKQIRASFLKLFVELLADYRSCLKVIRIFPKPFIAFHKAAFLGLRGFQDDEFVNRLVDSMSFQVFVGERGIPFRSCDLFDEVYATYLSTAEEQDSYERMFEYTQSLGQQLYNNEYPNNQPPVFISKALPQSASAIKNPELRSFPELDVEKVQAVISQNEENRKHKSITTGETTQSSALVYMKEVPFGRSLQKYDRGAPGNVRRLEVMRHCLRAIFDSKISEARKMLPAVLLSMKNSIVRVAFCVELESFLNLQKKATLEPQQFDLIIRLMNCALQNDSIYDEYGVAYSLITLATSFCRRLSTGVMQFAYTCIQDHDVWFDTQFWEACFFHDVHIQLKELYLNNALSGNFSSSPKRTTKHSFQGLALRDVWNLYDEPNSLRLAAEKLKNKNSMKENEQQELAKQEEAIVYSQAIHYANRIVYLQIPMDSTKLRNVNIRSLEKSNSRSTAVPSDAASYDEDSVDHGTDSDVESGYMDGEETDLGQKTVRWIAKFIDKVCSESSLSTEKVLHLHQMIPGVVAMHIESLEHIYRESRKLPPIHKPRMLVPVFLPGEQMLQGYLRVYLIPDGRQDTSKLTDRSYSSSFLPAEGAIFLTNYRIIFKGQPCDPYVCEQVVMRSVPVMSVTKAKRLGQQYVSLVDRSGPYLHDSIQIRSATFQLMKIAFDEEVSPEKVHTFQQSLDKLRWPEDIMNIFTLSTNTALYAAADKLVRQPKHMTIGGIAKQKLYKTVHKTGFMRPKEKVESEAAPSDVIKARSLSRSPFRPPFIDSEGDRASSVYDRDHARYGSIEKNVYSHTLDRLSERSYCKDYQRLGLCSKVEVTFHDGGTLTKTNVVPSSNGSDANYFRLTTVNKTYGVCRSYPAVLIIPSKISDDSCKKIAKGHKNGRFPVVVWRNIHGALLIRGAGFHVRSMVSRLKNQAVSQSAVNTLQLRRSTESVDRDRLNHQQMKSSVELERYFYCLVSLSPSSSVLGPRQLSISTDSLLSLDSLLLASIDAGGNSHFVPPSHTPDIGRKPMAGGSFDAVQKAMTAVRGSGGKSAKMIWNKGTLRTNYSGSSSLHSSTLAANRHSQLSVCSYGSQETLPSAVQMMRRASLYIFGDKSQSKVLKLDPKCEFVPVDYPQTHTTKEVFKKFMRAVVPASLPLISDNSSSSHLKALEESGWYRQIHSLLHIANAIVDVIDLQNSSVAVCLENGSDATTQVVSISELLLDPFYRTIEGFKLLVEKEWLAFGHRFSHRCNHTASSAASGFAPVFLQFLDAVHQIHMQYPAAFEFNDFYLRFLAFHSSSAYFRTFLLNCESDRVESGLLQFDCKPRPRPEITDVEEPSGNAGSSGHHSAGSLGRASAVNNVSVWDYIDEKHRRSCTFYNFLYNKGRYSVLRPQLTLASYDLWEFYIEDPICIGSPYDLEIVDAELLERSADRSDNLSDSGSISSTIGHRIIDPGYDSIIHSQPNCFSSLMEVATPSAQVCATPFHSIPCPPFPRLANVFITVRKYGKVPTCDQQFPDCANAMSVPADQDSHEGAERRMYGTAYFGFYPVLEEWTVDQDCRLEISSLQRELDVLPEHWEAVLFKVNQSLEVHEEESAQISFIGEWARWLSRTLHKKSTIELLLRGRMATQAFGRLSRIESGQRHNFIKCSFTAPEHCHVCNRIIWGVVRQGLRCSACDFVCHEKCASVDSLTCTRSRTSDSVSPQNSAIASEEARLAETLGNMGGLYNQESSVETRTHEGYLMKRGALLKAWKQRWFVLDSIQHQLRYYELMEDSHCKGFIDLGDVIAIGPSVSSPGSLKPTDTAYFELRTTRRLYSFMANSSREAQEWIEKIQSCLQ